MSMIRVENLTFSYPSSYDNIFENVNFQIDTDWKLGFVGRNGRGKTTFLNLLLGKYEYRGKISASVEFDYFPYPVKDIDRLTEDVLREVCPLGDPAGTVLARGRRGCPLETFWNALQRGADQGAAGGAVSERGTFPVDR